MHPWDVLKPSSEDTFIVQYSIDTNSLARIGFLRAWHVPLYPRSDDCSCLSVQPLRFGLNHHRTEICFGVGSNQAKAPDPCRVEIVEPLAHYGRGLRPPGLYTKRLHGHRECIHFFFHLVSLNVFCTRGSCSVPSQVSRISPLYVAPACFGFSRRYVAACSVPPSKK